MEEIQWLWVACAGRNAGLKYCWYNRKGDERAKVLAPDTLTERNACNCFWKRMGRIAHQPCIRQSLRPRSRPVSMAFRTFVPATPPWPSNIGINLSRWNQLSPSASNERPDLNGIRHGRQGKLVIMLNIPRSRCEKGPLDAHGIFWPDDKHFRDQSQTLCQAMAQT